MKLKTLALVTAAAFAAVGYDSASACSFSAWGQGLGAGQGTVATAGVATTSGTTSNGNPTTASLVAGEPDDASFGAAPNGVAVARYSGRCGSLSKASGNYVQDGLPAGEKTYRVRFYVFTGITAGTATVFEALDGSNARKIAVNYDAGAQQLQFQANTAAVTNVANVLQNRWYSVEFNWNANTPSMTATVFGAGNATALATDVAVAGVQAADAIETARLGWVSGSGTGSITTDAFESRRSTAIGRLCRGDANSDQLIGVQDRIVLTNEILQRSLSTGQPDVNEDGLIAVQDRILLTNRILASQTCP